MKVILILFVLAVIAAALPTPSDNEITVENNEWEEYKKKHDKNYAETAEDEKRRAIYLETKKAVAEHNKKYEAGELTYSLGINHFADLTEEERKKYTHGIVRPGAATKT